MLAGALDWRALAAAGAGFCCFAVLVATKRVWLKERGLAFGLLLNFVDVLAMFPQERLGFDPRLRGYTRLPRSSGG
jgi:hypothetical protein